MGQQFKMESQGNSDRTLMRRSSQMIRKKEEYSEPTEAGQEALMQPALPEATSMERRSLFDLERLKKDSSLPIKSKILNLSIDSRMSPPKW
jgi:hypothetical protein